MRPILRCICLTAALAALLAVNALAALREFSVPVSPGLSYTEQTEDAPGGYEQYYALTFKPGQGTAASVLAEDKVWGRSDPETLIASKRSGVVAAINSDFFTMTTGVPEGILIRNGVLYCSDSWQNAVGILPSGEVFIGRPEIVMWMKGAGHELQISYLNKTRTKAGLYLYSSLFGGESHITGQGTNVLLKLTGAATPQLGAAHSCRVVSVKKENGIPEVPAGYLLLTCSAAGPKEKLEGLKIGDELTLTLNCQDSRWKEVTYACGANKMLVQDGQVIQGLSTIRRACSALGLRADGSVVLLAGDGHVSGSLGTSHAHMAQKLAAMGCVTAVNLDGGGSTTLIATWPGETERRVMNTPSDGSVRPCATYIVLENTTPVTGNASSLYIRPALAYALPGARVPLSVTATDLSLHPVSEGGAQLEADGGTLEGRTLIAPAAGTVTVQASAAGAEPGFARIQVLDRVDVVRIRQNGANLSGISLEPGESVDLYAIATFNGKSVYTDDTDFTWTLDGGIGTVSEQGVLTASGVRGLTGTLTASYGQRSHTIQVTVGRRPTVLDGFEGTVPEDAAQTKEDAHNGEAALQLDSARPKSEEEVIVAEEPEELAIGPYALPKGTEALSVWAKGRGSLSFVTAAGETAAASISADGWQFLTFPVTAEAGRVTALRFEGRFVLDQLTAWPEAPITGDSRVQIVPNRNGTLFAALVVDGAGYALLQSDIRVTADGKTVPFTYDPGTGELTVQVGSARRVTVTVRDAAGNLARLSDVQETGDSPRFADMQGHWAAAAAEALAARGVITGDKVGDSLLFRPAETATREQTAVMLARALGLDGGSAALPDYADAGDISPWAHDAVAVLARAGIMQGTAVNGKLCFRPKAPVTREQIAAILGRTLERGYAAYPGKFADQAQIGAWAQPYVAVLRSLEVLSGYSDGTFRPGASVTRAELAVMLDRLS